MLCKLVPNSYQQLDIQCGMSFWAQDMPWELDALNDDVYCWTIKMKDFDESSPLAQVSPALLGPVAQPCGPQHVAWSCLLTARRGASSREDA